MTKSEGKSQALVVKRRTHGLKQTEKNPKSWSSDPDFTASASQVCQLVCGRGIKAHLDCAGSGADGLSLQPDFTAYGSESGPVLHYASMLSRAETC